ncbi:MAG: hypothetical protein U5L72_03560 [Bacteroidales bacterium]|nr:hypothetical protein [Bacteroidales bacterium]
MRNETVTHFCSPAPCFTPHALNNPGQEGPDLTTYCNPVDISYRFALDTPSRREAADPTVVRYKDQYLLFASMSGGYWHSSDLTEWKFTETSQIPTEEYAPTAVVMGDTIYFLASSTEKSTIYKSSDPLCRRVEHCGGRAGNTHLGSLHSFWMRITVFSLLGVFKRQSNLWS